MAYLQTTTPTETAIWTSLKRAVQGLANIRFDRPEVVNQSSISIGLPDRLLRDVGLTDHDLRKMGIRPPSEIRAEMQQQVEQARRTW